VAGSGPIALGRLTHPELAAIELSAQVMAHRAGLAARPLVARYFEVVRTAAGAEREVRGQPGSSAPGAVVLLPADASPEDRRGVLESLDLLIANEGLPAAVRAVFRQLADDARRQPPDEVHRLPVD